MKWKSLKPNEEGDWINQRNESFNEWTPIEPDKKFNLNSSSFFVLNSMGIASNRDAWVYNSSKKAVKNTMNNMVEFYNSQVDEYLKAKNQSKKEININNFIDTNPNKISWSSSLIPKLKNGQKAKFEVNKIFESSYRPFPKQNIYYGDKMIHRRSQSDNLFPNPNSCNNLIICVPGIGVTKDFTCLLTSQLTDMEIVGKTQCFPLYYYEERTKQTPGLFDQSGESEYIQHDGVSDFILERAKKRYGTSVIKEDIFYYVYGILHSKDYRETFKNDLKKMLPRLPLVDAPKDFWKFSKAGRVLADLHINYESVAPYEVVEVVGAESKHFTVSKMRFPKKDTKHTILYNGKITIKNIPKKAYEYVVNGKSAIEWIMERYQVKTDNKSGITNNPNDWSKEHDNPSYIFDLLLSIINVSVQTVDIVEGLPKLEFE